MAIKAICGAVRIAITFASIALLSACFSISRNVPKVMVYDPPEGEEGIRCVTQCAYSKNNCFRRCDARMQECRMREMQYNTIGSIVGIFGDLVLGSAGTHNKADRIKQECMRRRESCTSRCGYNSFCESQCSVEYKSCDTRSTEVVVDFKFGALPKRGGSLCHTRRCDSMCEEDYSACFIGCGGKIREKAPEDNTDTKS